jgi:hypothetical protein
MFTALFVARYGRPKALRAARSADEPKKTACEMSVNLDFSP